MNTEVIFLPRTSWTDCNPTSSFADMIQTNKRYGTKKLVRRRPVFVSAADAQTIKTRYLLLPLTQHETALAAGLHFR